MCNAFDHLIHPDQWEAQKEQPALVPPHLHCAIDEMNAWVYDTVNNGVYKVGFATSQAAYDAHITQLFESLDRLEHHLSQPSNHPYLFGTSITEADVRLYTTLIRFDVAYYPLFKCNVKMIRLDYPQLHAWLRRLYWSDGPETLGGVFRKTTHFDVVCFSALGYASKLTRKDQTRIRFCGTRKWRCPCWAESAYNVFIT
jgi:putative glutathione S-transferase